jgi:succinate dehydrogenase / fumarate reductase, cytochrome b subunit
MDRRKPAPKFLNLLQIELPPGGIASIAHRVSGVFMFMSIPLVAWLFGLSLQDEQGFRAALDYLQCLPLRLVSLLLVWSLAHHLLAGFRHLLLDLEIGISRSRARASAWVVNIGALALTALYLGTWL